MMRAPMTLSVGTLSATGLRPAGHGPKSSDKPVTNWHPSKLLVKRLRLVADRTLQKSISKAPRCALKVGLGASLLLDHSNQTASSYE